MKLIRVIKAKKINTNDKKVIEQIINCKDLNQICNMIGKTSDDIRVITYRKFYDFPDIVWYYKNLDFVNESNNQLPLTNRIISNVSKSIRMQGEFELSLPKNKRSVNYVNFIDNNNIDIMSYGGAYYHIYFNDPIKTKDGTIIYQ